MKKKKLIICEGPSDKRALEPLFPGSEYVLVHGDFLTGKNDLQLPEITQQNLKKELCSWVKSEIDKLNIRTKIKRSDVKRIIYITDSDNCFTSNTKNTFVKVYITNLKYKN